MAMRGTFALVSLVVCCFYFGTLGSLYIELSSCFINKNKLYTWIRGRSAEELNKKKKTKLYVLVSKDSWTVGYPEREKTGSIILI